MVTKVALVSLALLILIAIAGPVDSEPMQAVALMSGTEPPYSATEKFSPPKKSRLLAAACVELGGDCNELKDCCSDATYRSLATGCTPGKKCCN
jgi:hypothetical protein